MLISQKGAYYVIAANTAAASYWLFEARDRRTFRDLIAFNAAAVSVIALYITLWGLVSSPTAVFRATFLSHGQVVFGEFYNLEEHWRRTLSRNPFFYGGAVAGIVALCVARWRGRARETHLITAVYAAVLLILCRWHKQPWPYFFVLLIPTLMVVHAAVADLAWHTRRWRVIAVVAVLAGVIWPLTYMPAMLERDSAYQRHVIRLAHAMLDDGDTYLAGNDLIYNRHQALPALRRIDTTRLAAMKQWPPERIEALIVDLERVRPKLVISDTRMQLLPVPLLTYLRTRFDPLWSSVDGYAPLIAATDRSFDLWFDGDYRVEPLAGDALIDGERSAAGSLRRLRRGGHSIESASPVRLRLIPVALSRFSDPAMREYRLMFSRAYDY